MTEQTSGLRFDIYERVHLAEDQPDMKSLDSIEMIPLIQVNAEGEVYIGYSYTNLVSKHPPDKVLELD